MTPLISPKQLDTWRHSSTPPCLLDASWHLPTAERDPKKEFLASHLPGARFLDLSLFNDPSASLPNTLSGDNTVVAPHFNALDIHKDQSIVFYDRSALHTACRAYWLFRLWGFSADRLHILDGGFDSYNKEGFIISSGAPANAENPVSLTFQPDLLRTLDDIKAHLKAPHAQVVDLRHPVRFAGGPESRPGLRSGHIPGSFCFPFSSCFSLDGRFLPLNKITQRLNDIGVDIDSPIITCCGSGVTATVLNFVLDCLLHPHHALYDGSWTEWGADQCFPEEKDLSERPVETCLRQYSIPQLV